MRAKTTINAVPQPDPARARLKPDCSIQSTQHANHQATPESEAVGCNALRSDIREFQQTTTATARRASQTKGLMSKTIAVHVRFESLYISLPSSAKQQREMTKFYVFWRTRTAMANFSYLVFKKTSWVHVQPERVFRPTRLLDRFTQLRHSKVKYKFIFYKVLSPPSPSSLLKLPITSSTPDLLIEGRKFPLFKSNSIQIQQAAGLRQVTYSN